MTVTWFKAGILAQGETTAAWGWLVRQDLPQGQGQN